MREFLVELVNKKEISKRQKYKFELLVRLDVKEVTDLGQVFRGSPNDPSNTRINETIPENCVSDCSSN